MDHKLILNIEGLDGSGKNTISSLLFPGAVNILRMSFPDYQSATGKLVKNFLKGDIIDPKLADPITSSMFYVLDRRCQLSVLEESSRALSNYDGIIFDRSYMSNYFYQAMKYALDSNNEITNKSFENARSNIYKFQDIMKHLEIESTILNKYKHTMINVVLYHPNVETNIKLIERRGEKKDLYEKDKQFLKNVNDFIKISHTHQDRMSYLYKFDIIECSSEEGYIFPPEDIANKVAELIQERIVQWDID